MSGRLPVIALVGRPNVGKSTLFNRLTQTRDAIVADLPGLTRDRQYGLARYGGWRFVVVDTGGLGPEIGESLAQLAERQARLAIEEADHVVLLTDVRAGVLPADRDIADMLRRSGKPVTLAVNKAEGMDPAVGAAEFHALGLGEPVVISAEHGHGVGGLVRHVLEGLPEPEAEPGEDQPQDGAPIRVAVAGRPNAGKSTLVNRLLGAERVLAADAPGTTRDAIRVQFDWMGTPFEFVDTAGIRKRARVHDKVEKFSVVKTLQAMEAAEVVVVVVDARAGIGSQDARILGLAARYGRAMVLAVNKWDGLSEERRREVRDALHRLPYLDHVPVHCISALHGSGLRGLMRDVQRVREAAWRELPTPELNRVLEKALAAHAPPAVTGRRIKLRYAHQGGRNPPRIVIHGSRTDRLSADYRRYLVNRFREAFDLRGVPVILEFRSGDNPYDPKRR